MNIFINEKKTNFIKKFKILNSIELKKEIVFKQIK